MKLKLEIKVKVKVSAKIKVKDKAQGFGQSHNINERISQGLELKRSPIGLRDCVKRVFLLCEIVKTLFFLREFVK